MIKNMIEPKQLHRNDWRILKTITIISNERDKKIGFILYTRPLTETYHVNAHHNGDDRSCVFLKQPTVRDYPVDSIDTLIFESVKDMFPKSKVSNSDIFYDFHLADIKQQKERNNRFDSVMHFYPSFTNPHEFNAVEFEGKVTLPTPTISFNIYSGELHPPKEFGFFDGIVFFKAEYPITEPTVLNLLSTVEFL